MPPTLAQVLRAFLYLGATSFGGGRTAYFYDILVRRRRWIPTAGFLEDLTLGQMVPGPNVTNLAVVVGHRLAGLAGSVIAFGAVLLPGAAALMFLTVLYFHAGIPSSAQALIRGGAAAVAGLVVVMTLRLAATLRDWRSIAIVVVTFVAVGVLRLNTVATVFVVGGVSLWLHRPRA
jgi:chromate transporter